MQIYEKLAYQKNTFSQKEKDYDQPPSSSQMSLSVSVLRERVLILDLREVYLFSARST